MSGLVVAVVDILVVGEQLFSISLVLLFIFCFCFLFCFFSFNMKPKTICCRYSSVDSISIFS